MQVQAVLATFEIHVKLLICKFSAIVIILKMVKHNIKLSYLHNDTFINYLICYFVLSIDSSSG